MNILSQFLGRGASETSVVVIGPIPLTIYSIIYCSAGADVPGQVLPRYYGRSLCIV